MGRVQAVRCSEREGDQGDDRVADRDGGLAHKEELVDEGLDPGKIADPGVTSGRCCRAWRGRPCLYEFVFSKGCDNKCWECMRGEEIPVI